MFEVYYLKSPSGRGYVGFTARGADRRWLAHVKDAKRGSKYPLHRAIRKYGAESFARSLLERMTTGVGAKRAEQLWIKELGTFGPGGYNSTAGGEGVIGLIHSPETRAKMSESSRGKKKSPEHRANMSAAALGKKHSPETLVKMSESRLGKALSPEHRAKIGAAGLGRKHSHETRAKIGAGNRGKIRSPETRAKIGESRRGKPGKKHSPETCVKIGESLLGNKHWLGKKHSPETRAKMAEAQQLRRAKEKT